MSYIKYYKYKKQVSYDDGETWEDVSPEEYAPSGDPIGTYDTLEECMTEYRTIQSGTTCVGVDKHKQDVYEVSYDNGVTWSVVSTSAGTLIEADSYDCGYRTRTTTGTSYCVGYDKYVDIYSQVSTDYGSTWTTTATTTILIESDSPDCGYVPPTPSFEGKIKLTYSNGQTYSAECDSTSAVTYDDTKNIYTRSAMTSAIVGNCVTQILHDPVYRTSPFRQCSGLTSVLLPSSLRFIDDYSFAWCVNLTGIKIPYGVTSIGTNEILDDGGGSERGAFYDCRSLSSVTIPNSVTTIGKNAFMYCSGLTSIYIPDSVTTIGSQAFRYCTNLSSINIPSGVTVINYQIFDNCSGLTSIYIPSSVTSIGYWAFSYCSSLTSVTIPDSVISIDNRAFDHCSGLTNVTIGSGVTSIDVRAFQYCTNLSSINIPSGVTSIAEATFASCYALTSITIPSGVTSISDGAFGYCSGLTSVTVEATTPPSLGNNVFYYTHNCPIYVPSGSVNAYKSASGWSTYSSRIQAIPNS